jgi:hypothetical protein
LNFGSNQNIKIRPAEQIRFYNRKTTNYSLIKIELLFFVRVKNTYKILNLNKFYKIVALHNCANIQALELNSSPDKN